MLRPSLLNKGSQETRWVRANLSAFHTYDRSIPTFSALIGREEASYASDGDITNQRKAFRWLNKYPLLDRYSVASLDAQHLTFFPTTIMKSIFQLENNLKTWKNEWHLEESLQFAEIGSPIQIISNLKSGFFKPDVAEQVKTSTIRRINLNLKHHNYSRNELQHHWETIKEYFERRIQTSNVTIDNVVIAAVHVIDFTDKDGQDIVIKLKNYAKSY